MTYVKTVYNHKSYRLPDISSYDREEDADNFIRICLKWGIGIVSCEKINEGEAEGLLARGEAEAIE